MQIGHQKSFFVSCSAHAKQQSVMNLIVHHHHCTVCEWWTCDNLFFLSTGFQRTVLLLHFRATSKHGSASNCVEKSRGKVREMIPTKWVGPQWISSNAWKCLRNIVGFYYEKHIFTCSCTSLHTSLHIWQAIVLRQKDISCGNSLFHASARCLVGFSVLAWMPWYLQKGVNQIIMVERIIWHPSHLHFNLS